MQIAGFQYLGTPVGRSVGWFRVALLCWVVAQLLEGIYRSLRIYHSQAERKNASEW